MQEASLPRPGTTPANELARTVYRHMVRLRLVSARMVELQRSEKIAFHASCIGEEAVIVGAALAAREQDWIFPGAREWGAALVRGMPIASYVHHAFGTSLDPAKGRSSPDHAPARRFRIAPPTGVTGAHLPQAVGAAWAAKIKKDDVVALALFGEGATSTGDFHNAMNFAGVFKTPVVFVCRNNGRAAGTPSTRQTKSASFASKAVAYGVASIKIEGAHPVEVFGAIRAAVVRAAEGKGATLVEVVTQPPATTLPDGFWVSAALGVGDQDPLVLLRHYLERDDILDSGEAENLVAEVRAEIDAAVSAAERAAPPSPASIFEDVYAEVPRHLALQKESASWRR
ncbi:MAG TPA: thiamine pyrophosphate-dependent enzyme [Labilithrix sp.]|jgi:TPP-dependent pyruvate/acetoin dehydrogenase alpha subunit